MMFSSSMYRLGVIRLFPQYRLEWRWTGGRGTELAATPTSLPGRTTNLSVGSNRRRLGCHTGGRSHNTAAANIILADTLLAIATPTYIFAAMISTNPMLLPLAPPSAILTFQHLAPFFRLFFLLDRLGPLHLRVVIDPFQPFDLFLNSLVQHSFLLCGPFPPLRLFAYANELGIPFLLRGYQIRFQLLRFHFGADFRGSQFLEFGLHHFDEVAQLFGGSRLLSVDGTQRLERFVQSQRVARVDRFVEGVNGFDGSVVRVGGRFYTI
mmetsp:Transcript_19361/g.42045  ORF Transcript_19361/g.42045 Transcript_19361/m.42045 type:complete len:266 (-) Transcript_19361:1580-2377(-)